MRRLILPSLLILAAFLFHQEIPRDGSAPEIAWPWTTIFRVAASVVFLLAWRLRRGRVAWCTAALVCFAEALNPDGLGWAPAADVSADLRFVLGLLLPLAVGVLAWTTEFWVASRAGLWRWALLSVLVLAAYVATWPKAEPWLQAARSVGVPSEAAAPAWTQWSADVARNLDTVPAVLGLWGVGFMLCAGALWRRRTPVEAGLLGALVAVSLAYAGPDDLRYFMSAAVVVLGASLVENAFVLAFHDGLTGLPARRALEERLAQVGRTYALAMLDLDHFKKFNDKHGHEVGDQVLKLVASRLRQVTGGGEAFRYGGEEFTVVFAGRSAAEAKAHMDGLREDIAGRKFTVRSPGRPSKKPKGPGRTPMITKQLKVTVSIGVAERNDKHGTVDEVMKAADKALYQSKKAGRNRVSVAR